MLDPVSLAALAGSAAAGFFANKTARKGKWEQLQRFTPQQQQYFNQAAQQGMNQIQNPYAGFQPIADQANQNFHQNIIPTLAQRFTSQTNGALSSPSFTSQLAQASAQLPGQIAALQAQYGLQNQQQGHQLLGLGLTPQFENVYNQGGPTSLSSAFAGIGQGLGAYGNYGLQNYFQGQQDDRRFDQMQKMWNMMNPQGNGGRERGSAQDVQALMGSPQAPAYGNALLGQYSSGQLPQMDSSNPQQNFEQAIAGGYGANPMSQFNFTGSRYPTHYQPQIPGGGIFSPITQGLGYLGQVGANRQRAFAAQYGM